MESFVANIQFQNMIDVCAGWAFAFLVVWIITIASGLHSNLPLQAKNRLDGIRKLAIDLANKFDENCPAPDVKDIVKGIRTIMRKRKKVDKLLQVYLYDHGDNMEISSARGRLGKIGSYCKVSIQAITDEKLENVKSQMVLVERSARDAQDLLQVVIKKNEQEKLLRI